MSTVETTVEERAAEILQGAHDYIEANGFDIESYSGYAKSTGLTGPPRCYIGAVRTAAGLDPSPVEGDAGHGDGKELILALRTLDDLVRAELEEERVKEIHDEFGREGHNSYGTTVGRFIEQFGFQVQREAVDRELGREEADAFERDRALQILRKALTNIYG